jgi:hypothetical protein
MTQGLQRVLFCMPKQDQVYPIGFTYGRCMTQGLKQVLSDILSHCWARDVVREAQRVVALFEESRDAEAQLDVARKALNVEGAGLESSSKAQLVSVLGMLLSIGRNAGALRMVAHDLGFCQHGPSWRTVVDTLHRDQFYMDVEFLVSVLQPVAQAITAAQDGHATLSGVTRSWLHVARAAVSVVESALDAPAGEKRLIASQRAACPPMLFKRAVAIAHRLRRRGTACTACLSTSA